MTRRLLIRFGHVLSRRFLLEWLVIGCVGIGVSFSAASTHITQRADRLVYDLFLQHQASPHDNHIIIVDIDDRSIAALGRWPWPRLEHAALLDTISAAQPAAIIYDLLFTEPSPDPRDDQVLAQAMTAVPTYLPLLLDSDQGNGVAPGVREPIPQLAAVAAGFGHINVEADDDGIVRSVALLEGSPQHLYPQLTVPVYHALRGDTAKRPHGRADAAGDPSSLSRQRRILIPFNLDTNHYPQVSFISVLRGEVPPEFFHDKVVLVGVTAAGLLHPFVTPVAGEIGETPDVLLHANILNTLLAGTAIEPINIFVSAALSTLPAILLMFGLLMLSPLRSLLLTIMLGGGSFVVSWALLHFGLHWLSPIPALIGVLVIYPLWSWRRLEMAMSYLGQELRRLADEPHLLPEPLPLLATARGGDMLERYIALMDQASQRQSAMRRFIWDSLNSLPEPTLVADSEGRVLLANAPAREYFKDVRFERHVSLAQVFGRLRFIRTIDSEGGADLPLRAHWPQLLDLRRSEDVKLMERGVELRDAVERNYMLRYARCNNANGEPVGWIASLIDVTELHAAQRQRDDMLRLLSHDMRSPQASILALLETERHQIDAPRITQLFARIERASRRSLALADDFVQLARAEMQHYTLGLLNLAELAIEAADEVWPLAHAKQIEVDCNSSEPAYWVRVDRSLMTRALVNLLNNAIKYSPPQTRIDCTIGAGEIEPDTVQCVVRDRGYGIPREQQPYLFERFRRFRAPGQPPSDGIGLGLSFVKTVVNRHGGHIRVDSMPSLGTTITIVLPAASSPLLDIHSTELP